MIHPTPCVIIYIYKLITFSIRIIASFGYTYKRTGQQPAIRLFPKLGERQKNRYSNFDRNLNQNMIWLINIDDFYFSSLLLNFKCRRFIREHTFVRKRIFRDNFVLFLFTYILKLLNIMLFAGDSCIRSWYCGCNRQRRLRRRHHHPQTFIFQTG